MTVLLAVGLALIWRRLDQTEAELARLRASAGPTAESPTSPGSAEPRRRVTEAATAGPEERTCRAAPRTSWTRKALMHAETRWRVAEWELALAVPWLSSASPGSSPDP